ncbi:MAG: peptidylprolyl isomerase [Gemmatimonadota bacterium]
MVMRKMREHTKWIMLLLTVAFVGWLVFDWVQGGGGMGGGTDPVAGTVNGEEIRYSEWNQYVQGQLDQARQQLGGSLTDEQSHQARENAWDQLVTQRLIRQELSRLGLEATESEIRQAFRTSPPPDLRNHPAFQTDGEFDFQKYQQFFSGPNVDQNLLLQVEQYYRDAIPRSKLFRLVSSEPTITDDELWEIYRDQNEEARVRFVSLTPSRILADTSVEVGDDEIRSHYEANRDDFQRPRTSIVDIVSLEAGISPSDSADARAAVDSLRSRVASGDREFADLVDEVSEGGVGEIQGAEVGPVSEETLGGSLADAVFSLPPGQVSEPVSSSAGLHLVQVISREEGQATFRHVLVPITLSPEREDALFDRMDDLEGIALRAGLDAAADSLGLEIQRDVRLSQGSEFVPGAGALSVAVSWTFEADTEIGDLSQFFENPSGFHIVELKERMPAGQRALDEVRDEIRSELLTRKRMEAARARLEAVRERIDDGATLEQIAEENGWEVRESQPFTRSEFVEGLGRATPAVGAAFGLQPGDVAGPLRTADGLALVELIERTPADPSEYRSVVDQLRAQVEQERRQAYVERWMQALRDGAEVEDLRDQITTGSGQQQQSSSPIG